MPAKKGAGKPAEEEPPEPEVREVVEIVPPDPFDRYEEVWAASSLDTQRALVSEIWELPSGPSHSLQAISLDNAFHHLLFAKDNGMNAAAAKAWFETMTTLQAALQADAPDMAAALAVFKESLMKNSVLLAGPPVEPVVEKKEEEPVQEDSARGGGSRNTQRKNRPKSGSKPKTGKSQSEEPPEETPEPVVEKKPLLDPRFTVEQIRKATEYVAEGLISHFQLHRAVFNPEFFEPRKIVQSADVILTSVIPDGLKLMDAVDVDDEDAKLEAERAALAEEERQKALAELVDVGVDVDPESDVGKLVEKAVREARDQMRVTVAENAQGLENKLEELAAKLAAAK